VVTQRAAPITCVRQRDSLDHPIKISSRRAIPLAPRVVRITPPLCNCEPLAQTRGEPLESGRKLDSKSRAMHARRVRFPRTARLCADLCVPDTDENAFRVMKCVCIHRHTRSGIALSN